MYSTTQKGELSGGEKNTGNFRRVCETRHHSTPPRHILSPKTSLFNLQNICKFVTDTHIKTDRSKIYNSVMIIHTTIKEERLLYAKYKYLPRLFNSFILFVLSNCVNLKTLGLVL